MRSLQRKDQSLVWLMRKFFIWHLATLAVSVMCHILQHDCQAETATVSLQVITFAKNAAFNLLKNCAIGTKWNHEIVRIHNSFATQICVATHRLKNTVILH
jgi:hypothetical protein